MDTFDSKLSSAAIVFAVTLICGIVPFSLLRRYLGKDTARAEDKLSLLRCFAGGVFLATCLLHLLPEARKALKDAMNVSKYPVTEMTVGAGLLMLFVFENIVVACHTPNTDKPSQSESPQEPTSIEKKKSSEQVDFTSVLRPATPREIQNTTVTYLKYGSVSKSDETLSSVSSTSLNSANGDLYSKENKHSGPYSSIPEDEPLLDSTKEKIIITCKREDGVPNEPEIEQGHGHSHQPNEITGLRSFVLFLALSFHTVFDGLVIGLQRTATEVWTIMVAITLHKGLVAFSLGLCFLQSHGNKARAAVTYLILFSIVAPVGVGIGTVLTEVDFDQKAKAYAAGILQAVATGTFMYVTFFESLREDFSGKYHLLKVCSVVMGFGCVCGLRFAIND